MTLTARIDELMLPHVTVCPVCGARDYTELGLWGIEHITDMRHRLVPDEHECGKECA